MVRPVEQPQGRSSSDSTKWCRCEQRPPLPGSTLCLPCSKKYLESPLSLGALQINGRRSHPVIIGRKFYPELGQLRGDLGARDLFLKYPDQVLLVETGKNYDDRDIDTMEDYLDLTKEAAKKSSDAK